MPLLKLNRVCHLFPTVSASILSVRDTASSKLPTLGQRMLDGHPALHLCQRWVFTGVDPPVRLLPVNMGYHFCAFFQLQGIARRQHVLDNRLQIEHLVCVPSRNNSCWVSQRSWQPAVWIRQNADDYACSASAAA